MPATYTPSGSDTLEVTPAYSWLGDKIRQVTSHQMACVLGCGGATCKYCVPDGKFPSKDEVIKGVYSNWILPDFVAISRPSTRAINKYNIVEQFLKHNIKSIINLQTPDEHNKCGYPLEQGGFSYRPEQLMANGIYYYNYAWPDFGVPSLDQLLDAVQVVDFSVAQGKVAVHCHAGKGRTGTLIASYFVYVHRVPASAAILYVRQNREGSIQTKGQVFLVNELETFLDPYWVIFPHVEVGCKRYSLATALSMQRKILHGMESKKLRNIPKVVFVCCKLLKARAGLEDESCLSGGIGEFSKFPPELEKIVDIYFEKRSALSNAKNISKSSDDVADSTNFRAALKTISEKKPMRLLSPPQQPIVDQIASGQIKGEVFPVDSLIGTGSDRKMNSLRKQSASLSESWTQSDFKSAYSSRSADKKDQNDGTDATLSQSPNTFSAMQSAADNRKSVVESLTVAIDKTRVKRARSLEEEMNIAPRCWDLLIHESDPKIVSFILFDWLSHLDGPVLSRDDLKKLTAASGDLKLLGNDARNTVEAQIKTYLLASVNEETTETVLLLLKTLAALATSSEEREQMAAKLLSASSDIGVTVTSTETEVVRESSRQTEIWFRSLKLFCYLLKTLNPMVTDFEEKNRFDMGNSSPTFESWMTR